VFRGSMAHVQRGVCGSAVVPHVEWQWDVPSSLIRCQGGGFAKRGGYFERKNRLSLQNSLKFILSFGVYIVSLG